MIYKVINLIIPKKNEKLFKMIDITDLPLIYLRIFNLSLSASSKIAKSIQSEVDE